MPLSAYRMNLTEIHHGMRTPDGVAYAFDTHELNEYRRWLNQISEPGCRTEASQVEQVEITYPLGKQIHDSGSMLVLSVRPDGDLGKFVSKAPPSQRRSRRPATR